MKFRDKEKNILVDVFLKTAEYLLAIVILGQIISEKFRLRIFAGALLIFVVLVIVSLLISSSMEEK